MSIRTIQTAAVLDEISNTLFASGVNPTINQILGQMSHYFSLYPAGNTLPMPYDYIQANQITDVDKLNLLLVHIAMNIDFAYQSSLEQTGQLILLTTSLASTINKLSSQQKALLTQINDYLLSSYNTDGYYYSISDVFSDLAKTDLTMTSAFVDTNAGLVSLPNIANLSQVVDPSLLGTPVMSATIDGSSVNFQTISPMTFATNGLSNTVWEVQVRTNTPSEVVFLVTIPLANSGNPIPLSEIDITPYGVAPVQVFIQTGAVNPTTGLTNLSPFGGSVQTGINPMSFLAGSVVQANSIQLAFRKTQPDYTDTSSGSTQYLYIIGATNLAFVQKVYDNVATWVSSPLQVPTDLSNDVLIDAVSLSSDSVILENTNISYYVAQDPGNTTQLTDFNWQQISPLGSQSQDINTVVQFNGTLAYVVYIRKTPSAGDLQLIPLNNTNTNLSQQNPTSTIIPAVNIYTLANFSDNPLLNSLLLEEGINSTRLYSTSYNVTAVNNLNFWGAEVNNGSPTIQFGEIDTGHGFFYGGDIGENGVSVYLETYLYLNQGIEPVLDTLVKADQNSQTWSVRAYLNGSEIGWLPGRNKDTEDAPVDSLLMPWNFIQGQNHIALLINIPPTTSVTNISNPYIGTLDLLANHNLYQFGTVKLGNWNYVDFFDLEYNTVGSPKTFTIYNGQIISRCQPTTNYRLTYNKPSGTATEAIRLRADLSRDINNSYVTPKLNSYQLKFLYGNNG